MLLEYHTIYQLGAIAVSAITVKILTQPKARPIDLICDAVVLISAAIMFTERTRTHPGRDHSAIAALAKTNV